MRLFSVIAAAWTVFLTLAQAFPADPPTYDYIVIGAGNAGCPVAAQLVNAGFSVLLVEEGDGIPQPGDSDFMDHVAIRNTFNNWKTNRVNRFYSEPDLTGAGKEVLHGRGLGGTTSINAGIYSRPPNADFDDWGITFWDADHVNPFFKEIENVVGSPNPNSGTSGPIRVSNPQTSQTYTQQVINAFVNFFGFIEDEALGGDAIPGMVFENKVVISESGIRLDAFTAFISPLIMGGSPLITVQVNTRATKILFREGATNEVYGVKFLTEGYKNWIALVRKEVIISAGVFESPKLLQLSGIGAAADLAAIGVTQKVDLPHVGENLISRPLGLLVYSGTVVLPEQDISKEGNLEEIDNFFAGSGGYFATPIDAVISFVSHDGDLTPDFKLQFSSCQPPFESPVYTAMVFPCLLAHPASRGTVKANSNDPTEHPAVDFKFFTDISGKDITDMTACLGMGRVIAQEVGASIVGVEMMPGADIIEIADMINSIIATHRFSYHAFGTCKMGTDETDSVVDQRLKVHKFSNLRVVDGSVFPKSITSGPMGTIYMLGHRAGQLIIEDAASDIDPHNGYEVCQSGDYAIIEDHLLSSEINTACNSIGKVAFSTSDTILTCSAQGAVDALNSCGVTSAYLRPRGFQCDVLHDDGTLEKNHDCSGSLPVICVNGLF